MTPEIAAHADLFGDPGMPVPSRHTGYPAWFRQSLAYDLAILGPRPPQLPTALPAAVLVIGCSATKRALVGELAAWHRYDGPVWRTLRTHWTPGSIVRVYALSARHGLIPAETPIADYDTRLQDVVEHVVAGGRSLPVTAGDRIAQDWRHRLTWERLERSSRLLVVAGAAYRRVIGRWATRPYAHALGGIGEQRATLRRWLADRAALRVPP